MNLSLLDGSGLSYGDAADALEAALLAGFEPESDPPRTILGVGDGQLLVMPACVGAYAAVKLVTVGPVQPRVQGICVVFDTATLAPVALVDGVALTNLRTPAVSLVAARRLAAPSARHLTVFGRGPQARAHVDALRAEFPIERVDMLGRDDATEHAVAAADVIVCATTAREPLFDGTLVGDGACVIAIGSHEPDVREVDAVLARRATVVVESRASALREAGDVIANGLAQNDLSTLAELVRGDTGPGPGPRLFKSTGMAWEDAVVAAALARRS